MSSRPVKTSLGEGGGAASPGQTPVNTPRPIGDLQKLLNTSARPAQPPAAPETSPGNVLSTSAQLEQGLGKSHLDSDARSLGPNPVPSLPAACTLSAHGSHPPVPAASPRVQVRQAPIVVHKAASAPQTHMTSPIDVDTQAPIVVHKAGTGAEQPRMTQYFNPVKADARGSERRVPPLIEVPFGNGTGTLTYSEDMDDAPEIPSRTRPSHQHTAHTGPSHGANTGLWQAGSSISLDIGNRLYHRFQRVIEGPYMTDITFKPMSFSFFDGKIGVFLAFFTRCNVLDRLNFLLNNCPKYTHL